MISVPAIWLSPTKIDTWLVAHLARPMGKHLLFDYNVQSVIDHNVIQPAQLRRIIRPW
jgi:hypothetical protein